MTFVNMPGMCRSESGAVLITGLLMLAVLTILGVSRIQSAQLEMRMAGNFAQRTTAFESAEAAIRAAELFLTKSIWTLQAFDGDGRDGLYNDEIQQLWRVVEWEDDAEGSNRAVHVSGVNGAYVIQHYGFHEPVDYNDSNYEGANDDLVWELFRITARGVGPGGTGQVLIQATYEVSM
ncbi:MAG: PilX N-terminal domain-containing pilus assembly protein [Sedimenticola sp.]